MSTINEDLVKLKTVVWGPYGTNGLNREVKTTAKEIERVDGRVDGLYTLVFSLLATMIVGFIGTIAAVIVTSG